MRAIKLSLLALIILSGTEVFSQTTNYQVYSLFVYNIAKYSSWPSTNGEFTIDVLGKSKVYDELLKQVGKGVNGVPLKIRQVESETEIGQSQIIYVSDGKSSSLSELLKLTEGKPVMIITEREGLVKKGADFSFLITENNTLKFDMNTTKLEKRRIKVSNNIAGLANSVL
jgi:hypothetical protein